MRICLARDPESGVIEVTLAVRAEGPPHRRGRAVWMVRPGESFGPYTHQQLWDMGCGWHELEVPPDQPQAGTATG